MHNAGTRLLLLLKSFVDFIYVDKMLPATPHGRHISV